MTGLGIWFCRQCLQLALGYYRMYQPKCLFSMAGISKFSRKIMSFFCSYITKSCVWFIQIGILIFSIHYNIVLMGMSKTAVTSLKISVLTFPYPLFNYFSFFQIQDRRPKICKTKSCILEFCLTEGQINFQTKYHLSFKKVKYESILFIDWRCIN